MESYRVGQKGFAVGDAEEFVEMVAFDTAASHGAEFGRGAEEVDVLADIATVNCGIEIADFFVFEN